ncbi:MFS transporter [Bradyrhizobium sp. CW4]|uniref:MFS transporter n=1 Tax=Bradyrhizobium sp. CW4 TaxID=2782687 RepID=UPI001FF75E04|nr:MFS transporter [Bradyrhizobium sp. CW4]MCK1412358.1 MFS transporter [Bradyrhizobium sp. CW4]
MPAAAITDMHDRRNLPLVALSIEICGAVALIMVEWSGFTTPTLLLVLCFVMGSGMAGAIATFW